MSARLWVLALWLATAAGAAPGQSVIVGTAGDPGFGREPNGGRNTEIFLAIGNANGANRAGTVIAASFAWTSGPCPGAARIKFFRPQGQTMKFLTERGPFDVPAFPQASLTVVSVRLDPPVALEAGDQIGISNVTGCGEPAALRIICTLPSSLCPGTLVLPGDVTSDVSIAGTNAGFSIWVQATDVPVLYVLAGRFAITLTATDPRTGRTTSGAARMLNDESGYFSLPEFTGDVDVPEVTVKMVNATSAAPPFGGAFWFFYSPLTDVTYTLTVTDQKYPFRVRTYSSAGSSAFCGAGDTNAFPP